MSLATPNGRVTSMSFSTRDAYLTGVTGEGFVHLWGASDWSDTSECYKTSSTDSTFSSTTAFSDDIPYTVSLGAHHSTKQGLIYETGKFGAETKRVLVAGTRFTESVAITCEVAMKDTGGGGDKGLPAGMSAPPFTSLVCGT